KKMREDYGEEVFLNAGKANNMLKDLAPGMPRERLQLRNILEMGVYSQLQRAGDDLPIVRNKLALEYAGTYCVDQGVADWIVGVLCCAAGYEHELAACVPFAQDAARTPKTYDPAYRALIGAGTYHSVALRQDGTVIATGDNECGQCDVSGWRNIIAVAAGGFHTAAIKKDGTALAVGDNIEGQCDVRRWEDMISLHLSSRHTVGLRSDGRVMAAGRNKNGECEVSHWRNIVGISVDFGVTYGIKTDGTVVSAGDVPYDRYDVTALTNVSGLAGMRHRGLIMALKKDGTVVKPRSAQNRVKWEEIDSLVATRDCFIGLTKDGKVKILEYYWASSGVECSLDDWGGIIAIAAGAHHALGLRSNGTVVAAMLDGDPQNDEGQCEVGEFAEVELP
ncbi:MAG: hypothetical protein FWE68_04205, partial [Defluviitaleaceae bacterium]|nr:hypothetical protein [Defluviitaleaceae bacterium]